jgi:hypothetical protein
MSQLISPTIWPLLQLIACVVVIGHVLMYRRGTSRHRPAIAWLAWCVLTANMLIAIKLLCGIRPPPGPLEALLTVATAAWVSWHRGDVAHALRSLLHAARTFRRGAGR